MRGSENVESPYGSFVVTNMSSLGIPELRTALPTCSSLSAKRLDGTPYARGGEVDHNQKPRENVPSCIGNQASVTNPPYRGDGTRSCQINNLETRARHDTTPTLRAFSHISSTSWPPPGVPIHHLCESQAKVKPKKSTRYPKPIEGNCMPLLNVK